MSRVYHKQLNICETECAKYVIVEKKYKKEIRKSEFEFNSLRIESFRKNSYFKIEYVPTFSENIPGSLL